MNKYKSLIILFFIVILAAVLRFWDLGKNPPGINLDEAAIGWNAYSILKTGRDEYGQYFPLQFRNLDDYKPPLYIYLTVPSVAIFGMNEFSVRLPSALLGIGAVIIVYFLTKELFKNYRIENSLKTENCKLKIALTASALLTISPWHLQFTRTAYETGSLAFFTSGGLLFFLLGQKKWPWLILSAVFFGMELYLYQAAKVFVPLFIFVLFLLYFKKSLFLFAVIFTLFFLPSFYLSITPEGRLRAWGTSIFQEMRPQKLDYAPTIINNYLLHFSPQFLFGLNLGPKVTYVPNVGLMYLWELPLLLAGFYYLFKEKNKKLALILTAWLLLAPIPASITIGLPSSIRTAIFLPSLQIITALGAINLFKKYRALVPLFYILASIFLFYYLYMWSTRALSMALKIGTKVIAKLSRNLPSWLLNTIASLFPIAWINL